MTAYTPLDVNTLLAGGPIPASHGLAFFQNPLGLLEGAPGVPMNAAAWHPYDLTEGSADTEEGIFFDGSVDASMSEITLEAGWEYRVVLEETLASGTATAQALTIEYYLGTSLAYTSKQVISESQSANSTPVTAEIELITPSVPKNIFRIDAVSVAGSLAGAAAVQFYNLAIKSATRQAATKARITRNGEVITDGKVYLYRRREYISA